MDNNCRKYDNTICSYEDLVVYSSKMKIDEINKLARKLCYTIRKFEELHYLMSYLTDETIEYIITERTDLITEHTNIDCLRTNIDPCVYNTLQNIIRSRDANRGEKNSEH